MRQYARRFAGPLLVAAVGAGLVTAPAPAFAAGATVTVDVRSTLKVRSAPSLAAKVVGSLRDNQRVAAVCSITGQNVRGSVRTTAQWDKLSTGGYITHAYVSVNTGDLPRCATTSPQAAAVKVKPGKKPATPSKYKTGTVKSADGKVNIRTGPSVAAPVKRVVTTGAKVSGVCYVQGTKVVGTVRSTTQWNRLSDGSYISHAYVVTPALSVCPGTPATTPSTPGVALTPEQFIKAAVPGAQQGWREYGVPASVTLAQAILESGWGRSGLSTVDRNYFGIKCQSGKFGTLANGCHDYRTQECTKAGECFSTVASFRTYASMGHSFRDHGNFLRVNPRYAGAFNYTTQANSFIWKVWKAGYATDPNYYTKVTTLMASQNLYQYDIWK
ncbi:sporangiospore maturation cell wall hydrolase GsmA [Paractinoplanes lichenicola]|uniref:Sporangiospore maturation cell wall hydrolase GsmA n=1 Tax=Paractinoplanes lichenicola TaxID=2802976 RepID=A0ABS1VV92_9ACTN|nr:sporangiospore maturation cell wall hydrolase GsmA [Actinoplanes lichenicola]MBL7258397.1 sporangiospore maturation cell wall hydrolase GsmA [Actinoplanes lichenicola]